MTIRAEELWEKQPGVSDEGVMLIAMTKQSFLAALREYGAAVRARDAEIARSECLVDGLDTSDDIAYNLAVADCAAAIVREELP